MLQFTCFDDFDDHQASNMGSDPEINNNCCLSSPFFPVISVMSCQEKGQKLMEKICVMQ